jgi:hypothetical protein
VPTVVHLIQITRGSRPVDGEATAADAHGANAGFDEEVIMASAVDVPEVEWVFACATVLGGAHPDTRDGLFMERVVKYHPTGSIGAGTRWCSGPWLDRHPVRRGNPARVQGMASHIGFTRRGKTLRPYIVVVPDEGLDHAAHLAATALERSPDDPAGLTNWAFAAVRFPGRTRFGIRLRGHGWEQVTDQLDAEVGIEWRFWFVPGGSTPTGGVTPDTCTIADGKGTPLVTWRDGLILMEDEPVPDQLLALADEHGNGFDVARELGWDLTLPTTRNRDLEPDELATPRGYLDPTADVADQ